MKLFRQLLSRKAQPKKPESRLSRLANEPQATLEALVEGSQGDPSDVEVRVAALQRLQYSPVVRHAAFDGPPAVERAARVHLANLIDTGAVSVPQLIADFDQPEKLLSIAGLCKTAELQTHVLADIQDQAMLADICTKTPSAAIRQTLAQRIDEPNLLRELAQAFKNKDKSAYKIVKGKLDEIKAAKDAEIERQNRIEKLCADVTQHSQRTFDKDYSLRLRSLERRWSELADHAQTSEQQQVAAALKVCHERAQDAVREEPAEVEIPEAESTRLEVNSGRDELLNTLSNQLLAVYQWETTDDAKRQEAKANLTAVQEQWNTDLDLGEANTAQARQYQSLCTAIETVMQLSVEKGTLNACLQRIEVAANTATDQEFSVDKASAENTLSVDPQVDANAQASNDVAPRNGNEAASDDIHHVQQLLAPLKSIRHFKPDETVANTVGRAQQLLRNIAALKATKERQERELKHKQVRVVTGLLRRSDAAVQQGRLKQALGIRHSIDEKLEQLDGLPNHVIEQLNSLDEAIQKLIDWQAYAVVPKKEALVEAMEALVGVDLPPEALATKVKKLQDEWKELAQSGKDRQEDLWQRFSDAADKAYEPCKAFYQELSVVRKQNLGKRKALVKQLQDYLQQNDWDNADWRQVEKVLHTARQELHSYTPVDRGANKSVLTQFDEAMAAIQAKLEGEYDKNKQSKEQIVSQAEKLTGLGDLDQAIETAKRLQAQWKTIGRCNYKENERLWKQFRQHCDGVFAKKQSAMAEQNAVLDDNEAKANSLMDDLKKLLAFSGEEFLATRADKDRIKAAFAEVGDLPTKSEKPTQRAFSQLLERYDDKVKQQMQQADQDAWNTLFSINEDINAYLLSANTNSPDATALKDAASEKIAATNRWPEGAQPKVKRKLDEAATVDLEANQETLRLLCIRAEILGDIASPGEDKAKRMEYQVNLLQKGLGQVSTASPEALALDWIEVGPVPADAYQVLFQRFQKVWQKLM